MLGSLLLTMDGCDEDSLAKSCKDLKVETGGTLTEVHNRILQLDILNQDNGKAGSTGVDCPVCSVSLFSTLEIVALTLNKIQETAETRRKIIEELELERGITSNVVSAKSNKDDQEIPGWEEAVLS